MISRPFGPTKVHVPVIGQGTWKTGPDGVEAIQVGISLGMTQIDTAEMYTGAESVVAAAIKDQRGGIFLVSKVLPSNAKLLIPIMFARMPEAPAGSWIRKICK
jgi:diketogulonate reductase-like aldo/keto reductase